MTQVLKKRILIIMENFENFDTRDAEKENFDAVREEVTENAYEVNQEGIRMKKKERSKIGKAALYPEEVLDESTEDAENKILENIDEETAHKQREEILRVEERTERNAALPEEVRNAVRAHSLPPDAWNKLSPQEQKQRLQAIQKAKDEHNLSEFNKKVKERQQLTQKERAKDLAKKREQADWAPSSF